MNEHDHGHEHTAKDEPVIQPTRDEVAKQAYVIYTKEGNLSDRGFRERAKDPVVQTLPAAVRREDHT